MNEDQFDYIHGLYTRNPSMFTEEQVDRLADAGQRLNKSFKRDEEQSEFNFSRTLAQLGSGFVSGFTTIQVGGQPTNTVEAIARSVGSLAGFVGYVPGPGLAGRIGMSAIGRSLGLGRMGKLAGMPSRLPVKSVPFYVADKVVRGVEKVSPAGAAMSFLSDKGRDIVQAGVQLGTASAVSSWQQGVDGMMKGFALGAVEGGGFRAIANYVRLGDPGMEKIVRASADAIYSGLPSTIAGDPLGMQVYQYLLGTYFGMTEVPLQQRQAATFLQRNVAAHPDANETLNRMFSPERIPEYKELSADVREEVDHYLLLSAGKYVDKVTSGTAVMGAAGREAIAKLPADHPARVAFEEVIATSARNEGQGNEAVSELGDAALKQAVLGTHWKNSFTEGIRNGMSDIEAFRHAGKKRAEMEGDVSIALEREFSTGISYLDVGRNDAREALEDYDLPTLFEQPIVTMARSAKNPEAFMRASRKEIAGILNDPATQDGPEMMDQIAERVKALDPDVPLEYDALRQSVRSYMGNTRKRTAYLSRSGELVEGDIMPMGKRIGQVGNPSHLEKKLDDVLVVKNAETIIDDDFAEAAFFDEDVAMPFVEFTKRLGGRHLVGVAKAKGEAITTDFLPARIAPHGAESTIAAGDTGAINAYIDRRIESLKEVDPDLPEHFASLKRDFVKEFKEADVDEIGGMSVEDYYNASWVNNITAIEHLNSMNDGRTVSFEEMVRENRTGNKDDANRWLLSPSDWNRRLQGFTSSGAPASAGFYRDVRVVRDDTEGPSLADLGGIPAVIIADARNVGLQGKGIAHPSIRVSKDILVQAEAHTDGSAILADHVFDAMFGKDAGLSAGTGAGKATLFFSDGQTADAQPAGAFYGKLAFFRATDAESRAIESQGVSALLFNTAVKQRGRRKMHDYYVREDGTIRLLDRDQKDMRKTSSVEPFILPFDGIRINTASSEHTRTMVKGAEFPVQVPNSFDDLTAINEWMDRYVGPSIRGDEEATKRWVAGEDLTSFDADKMHLHEIQKIAFAERPDPKLYSKVWHDILFKKGSEDYDIDFNEGKFESVADRVFEALKEKGEITPELIHLDKSVRQLAIHRFTQYIKKRVDKPYSEYAGSAILSPSDGMQQMRLRKMAKSGSFDTVYGGKAKKSLKKGIIPEGYVMLGNAYRKKKIKWLNGSTATMEDALRQYWSASKKNVDTRDMQDLLTLTTVRVPADSKRNIVNLKLLGFTGRAGATMAVHPQEMGRLGGADLDIDKAFFFQDIDGAGTGRGPIRNFFDAAKQPFFEDVSERYKDRFIDTSRPDYEKGAAAMFDPRVGYQVGGASYRGNKLIGVPAVSMRRLNATWEKMKGQRVRGERQIDDNTRIVFNVQMGTSRRSYDEASTVLFNAAADSAKAPLKVDAQRAGEELAATLARRQSATLQRRKGDEWVDVRDVTGEYRVALNELDPIRPLVFADAAFRKRTGKGRRRTYFDAMRNVAELEPYDSVPYRSLNEALTPVTDQVFPIGENQGGKRPIVNPSDVVPSISSSSIDHWVKRFNATITDARDGDPEAQLDMFLAGNVRPPSEQSLDYRETWRLQNDFADLVSTVVLPMKGRAAMEEIQGSGASRKDAIKVIRGIQKRWYNPPYMGGAGFRQRIVASRSSARDLNRVETEPLDAIFVEMSEMANRLEQEYGQATRQYFEMIVRSSSLPISVDSKDIMANTGDVSLASRAVGSRAGSFFRGEVQNNQDLQGYLNLVANAYVNNTNRKVREAEPIPYKKGMSFNEVRNLVAKKKEREYVARAQREIMNTNQTVPALLWDGISAHTHREWADGIKQVARGADRPETREESFLDSGRVEVNTLYDVPIDNDLSWDPNSPELTRIKSDMTLKLFGKDTQRAADEAKIFDPNTEEGRANLERKEQLVRIFDAHPEIIATLTESVPGTLSGDGVPRSAEALTNADVDAFIRFFKKTKRAGVLDALFSKRDARDLPKFAHFFFPDYVAKRARQQEFEISEQIRQQVLTSKGIVDMPVRRFYSTFEREKQYFDAAYKGIDNNEILRRRNLDRLINWMSADAIGDDARDLMTVATVLRELPLVAPTDEAGNIIRDNAGGIRYGEKAHKTEEWARFKQIEEVYKKLRNKKYTLPLPIIHEGGSKEGRFVRYEDVPDYTNGKKRIPEGKSPKDLVLKLRTVSGKDLFGTLSDPSRGIINKALTNHLATMDRMFIHTDNKTTRKIMVADKFGGIDYHAALRMIDEHLDRQRDFPMLGADNLNKLHYEQQIRFYAPVRIGDVVDSIEGHLADGRIDQIQYNNRLRQLRKDHPFEWQNDHELYKTVYKEIGDDTFEARAVRKNITTARAIGLVKSEFYFPRLGHDDKVFMKHLRLLEKKAKETTDEAERKKLLIQIQQMYSRAKVPEDAITSQLRDMVFRGRPSSENASPSQSPLINPSPFKSRGQVPLPGWDPTERAIHLYNRMVVKGAYDQTASLMANHKILKFEIEKPMGEFTQAWAGWGRTFLNTYLGHNTMYSDQLLKDSPHLRNSAAYYTSDRNAWEIYKKVHSKIRGKRWKEIQEIEAQAKAEGIDPVTDPRVQRFATDVRRVSFIEGRWNLMSLLANSRSMMNNVWGGNAMTMVSTGLRPWLSTFNQKHWTSINPDWKRWEDIREFAEANGAVESYIRNEANLQGAVFSSKNVQRFMENAIAAIKARGQKGETLSDNELRKMARDQGLKEGFVDSAAWFMRTAERDLRLRSFMAHYFKFRDLLGASGQSIPFDDPTLLELARKGVEGTQFLYHSAARPIASSSSIGKIFSRFQPWAWNSVRFRRDVYKKAKELGFKPGTEDFKRFQRTATADLFMLGLASAFPFSLFGATTPAPLNYVQDLSEYFFGDEEDKERAFFGVLPYPLNVTGLVLPPSSRIFTAMMNLAGGDVDRFVDYQFWTMVPFGPMARNVYKTVNNPTMAVEYMTGFPLHQVGRELRKTREQSGGVGPDWLLTGESGTEE